MKRASGVLMHISSLPGKYGCGDFGDDAVRFIDFLCNCGFSYWQTLPFGVVDEYNSPYQSYSAFAGNPYFISLDKLVCDGLLTREEASSEIESTPYLCEFDRLRESRVKLLIKASTRCDEILKNEIAKYISENEKIGTFCKFMAIKEANGGKAFIDWTCEEYSDEVLFGWQFIQYEFFKQWFELKKYANENGISLIGDIPIYVSADSADVWEDKSQFDLNKDGSLHSVAGCPPDYFAADGQRWGNPLYLWNRMKKDDYSFWSERIRHMLNLFDGVRIDHFRGLESYWSIPAQAKTAASGSWKKGPGKDFIRKIRSIADDKLVIAEDLGDITKEVRELVDYSGFPGMRVFQFAFMGDKNSPHLPHNYPHNCVAYTGTHDNNTLLGHIWSLDCETRKRVFDYCGYVGENWDTREAYEAIMRTMLKSSADLVIFPIQDILGYGEDTRMNTPGSDKGNWAYRVCKEQLDSIDCEKWKHLNELYSR